MSDTPIYEDMTFAQCVESWAAHKSHAELLSDEASVAEGQWSKHLDTLDVVERGKARWAGPGAALWDAYMDVSTRHQLARIRAQELEFIITRYLSKPETVSE